MATREEQFGVEVVLDPANRTREEQFGVEALLAPTSLLVRLEQFGVEVLVPHAMAGPRAHAYAYVIG